MKYLRSQQCIQGAHPKALHRGTIPIAPHCAMLRWCIEMKTVLLHQLCEKLTLAITQSSTFIGPLLSTRLLWGVSFIACLSVADAQTVTWKIPDAGFVRGNKEILQLVYDGCSPEGTPTLPNVEHLVISDTPSVSRQTQIVNFSTVVNNVTLSYAVMASKAGEYVLPDLEVMTNKGAVKVPSIRFTVSERQARSSKQQSSIQAELVASPESVYVGQVFELKYELTAVQNLVSRYGYVQWEEDRVISDPWPQEPKVQAVGNRRSLYTFGKEALFPDTGVYQLPWAQLDVEIRTSRRDFFRNFVKDVVSVPTEPITMEVRPLPPDDTGKFSGAIGDFRLTSKVLPKNVKEGDPVTWTLELTGKGNWPLEFQKPNPGLPSNVRVIRPDDKVEIDDTNQFQGTWTQDFVIVTEAAGTIELPALDYVYFDPTMDLYKTLEVKPDQIVVEKGDYQPPATPTVASVPKSSQGGESADIDPKGLSMEEKSLAPADLLPAQPAIGSGKVFGPVDDRLFYLIVALPILMLFCGWFYLAMHRVILRDESKTRREAFKRLKANIKKLKVCSGQGVREGLVAWQEDVMRLWAGKYVAPSWSVLKEGLVKEGYEREVDIWLGLWQEAESGLYARNESVSREWGRRADEVLQRVKLPWVPFWRVFYPKYLLPLLVMGLCLSGRVDASASGLKLYEKGKFADAASEFEILVDQTPKDWVARQNLGLSLYQQDQLADATGHWVSALVLNPRNDDVRWNLTLANEKEARLDPLVRDVLREQGLWMLFGKASPFEWQLIVWMGVICLVIGCAILLIQKYQIIQKDFSTGGFILGLIGILATGLGGYALWEYDLLKEPWAVVVKNESGLLYSIPSDVADDQEKRELRLGTVGVVTSDERIGWVALKLSSGESGWVREKDLVYLYQ
ncbi:MAG: BatD family protein [Verrucomicrobiota bacterium]